jgi:hypothetical protein
MGYQLAMDLGFEFLISRAAIVQKAQDPSLIVSINFEPADFSLYPLFKF